MTAATTLTVTAFLLARLDDDEAVALDFIGEGPWQEWARQDFSAPTRDDEYAQLAIGAGRVLAQVAALRAVVEAVWNLESFDYPDSGTYAYVARKQNAILLALCQPYADHEDFDPSWLAS